MDKDIIDDENNYLLKSLRSRVAAKKLVVTVVIVFLVIIQLNIYYQIRALSHRSLLLTQVGTTIQTANAVLDKTANLELNVRNYLLTSDESYVADIQEKSDDLINTSNQYDIISPAHISALIKNRLTTLNKIVQLKQNGTILPSDILSINRDNQSFIDKINASVNATINTQYQFLKFIEDKSKTSLTIIFTLIVIGVILSLSLLIRQMFLLLLPQKDIEVSLEETNNVNKKLHAIEGQNEKMTLLLEMSDVMLASENIQELSNIIAKYCGRILSFSSGLLYIMHPSKNYLEATACWGSPSSNESYFSVDRCWSIRLGHIYDASSNDRELFCEHVKPDETKNGKDFSYLCVPLRARNDIYGLLYIEIDSIDHTKRSLSPNERLLVNSFTELAALALANINLQHSLQYQSLRDHLTSLYNRRYLEEFLTKQIMQSERTQLPIAVLMIDIDNFKQINDKYGHEAGDMAIKELALIFLKDVRPGDLAARYGGEEFIIVLYNIGELVVKKRAEKLREDAAKIRIKRGVDDIISFTISIGVSLYPRDGNTSSALIESADKALYFAKNSGKDKVVLLSEITSNLSP